MEKSFFFRNGFVGKYQTLFLTITSSGFLPYPCRTAFIVQSRSVKWETLLPVIATGIGNWLKMDTWTLPDEYEFWHHLSSGCEWPALGSSSSDGNFLMMNEDNLRIRLTEGRKTGDKTQWNRTLAPESWTSRLNYCQKLTFHFCETTFSLWLS